MIEHPWLTNPHDASFCGVKMLQVWPDLLLWERVLNAHPVRRIVELGTAYGGLTYFLAAQAMARQALIDTFDVNRPEAMFRPLALALPITVHQEDIWTGPGMNQILANLAQRPLCLLCDGGDKRREFNVFVPQLKSGDIVAVHDWGREIGPEDVKGHLANLEPIMEAECEQLESWTRWWRRR